jgi:hypothetical protein
VKWIGLAAWALTLAEVVPRLADGSLFDLFLAALAVAGIAACFAWLRGWRNARTIVLGCALSYIGYYVVRLYLLEVRPLLAIMPLPEAVVDAFYVVWSSPMGRLSHGEVTDALAQLYRECFMPLIQAAVLAGLGTRES